MRKFFFKYLQWKVVFHTCSVFILFLLSATQVLSASQVLGATQAVYVQADSGVIAPEIQSARIQTNVMKLNKVPFIKIGEANFSVLFWDIYTSTLFTASGRYPVNTNEFPLLFEINYLKDISREELIERTMEQWEYLGYSPAFYQAYVPTLKRIWPNIKAGDSLAMLVSNEQTRFYHNDEFSGDINGKKFGPLFLDIWLSEKTSQPKLRAQLLGFMPYESN